MKKVALFGAGGYVGSQIANAINNSNQYHLIPLFRSSSNIEKLIVDADIVIHSANPAGRFQAETYPIVDFEETVEKTARIFNLSKGKHFILVSSMSCRTQLHLHYGRFRRACELLVLTGNSLVVRLGPMFGGNRKRDMLHDILMGKEVHIAEDTQYAYVNVAWAGQKIVDLLEKGTGVQEIGARNSIRLGDIANHFNSKSLFSGIIETQIPENFSDGPDANDIYAYAEAEKER